MAYLSGKPDITTATLKVADLADGEQPESAQVLPWTSTMEQTVESGFEETIDARGEYANLVERLDDTLTTAQVLAVPDPTEVPDGYVLTVSGGVPVWSAPPDIGTLPGQVTGLAATTGSGSGEIDLTWTAPAPGDSAITTYSVQYRVTSVGGAWSTFTHAASTATSITITGTTPATGYDTHVAAVSALGTGTYSTTDTATSGGTSGGYTDDFTTLDGGWAPMGDATGLAAVSGNLQKAGGADNAIGGAVRDCGSASGTVTAVGVAFDTVGSFMGVVFWYVDATNYCFVTQYGTSIWRVNAGVATEIATAGAGGGDPSTTSVVLDATAHSIQCYSNENGTVSHTDVTIPTSTYHGVLLKLNASGLVTSFSFAEPE